MFHFNSTITMFRKTLLVWLLTAFCGLYSINASALNASEIFSIDENTLQTELAALNAIEEVVMQHQETADFAFVQSNYAYTLVSLNGMLDATSTLEGNAAQEHPVLGIPSFLWGCCFGVLGILLVYLVADDEGKEVQRAESRKALTGCAIAYGAIAVVYIVLIIAGTAGTI